MSDKLFEFGLGELFCCEHVNDLNKIVDDLRLFTGFQAHAHGIVADDDGKDRSYCEFK